MVDARLPDGKYATTVQLGISDATKVPAESFLLRADPSGTPGRYQLSTRPDGQPELLTVAEIESRYGLTLSESGAPRRA